MAEREQNDNNRDRAQQQPQGQQSQQQPQGQQSELGTEEPTSEQSNPDAGQTSGGFVGSEREDSGEYLQKSGNPESGFAEEGQGAPDQGDIERGTESSQNRESDIEGSSDSNA